MRRPQSTGDWACRISICTARARSRWSRREIVRAAHARSRPRARGAAKYLFVDQISPDSICISCRISGRAARKSLHRAAADCGVRGNPLHRLCAAALRPRFPAASARIRNRRRQRVGSGPHLRGPGPRGLSPGHRDRAHDWGEILYLKDVWPDIPGLGYFEFFYRASGSDVGFDPEFPGEADLPMLLRSRNATNLLGLDASDRGQTPTAWQRDQYPQIHRERISVIHEGVDTGVMRPDRDAQLWLGSGISFRRGDELLTYSARNLEPYRGFHVFMRALPRVVSRRPDAHVAIVGGNGVTYGRPPLRHDSWRSRMLAELAGQLDPKRVHFLGTLPFQQYRTLLQVSAVHCYLTYPFVLSWSLIEALAAGCAVVASRTPPVEEVIEHGRNGRLVDFFDVEGLADELADRLGDALRSESPLRSAARQTAIDRFDLQRIRLPRYRALLESMFGVIESRTAAPFSSTVLGG